MERESDYLVRNPKRILEHLSDLVRRKCIITAQMGENNESFLTAILEINQKQNMMKLDCAPSELLNKQLLNSSKVLFRTELDGIKASFAGKGIKKSESAGHPAIAMPIPDAIFWLQRREFYRVRIPLSHEKSYCQIAFKLDSAENGDIQTSNFRLEDICIHGFALTNNNPEFEGHFQNDKAFHECLLHLHNGSHANVSFVVKNIMEVKTNTTRQQRIGCLFTEVSPAFESNIQRYMQDIERLLKNIAGA